MHSRSTSTVTIDAPHSRVSCRSWVIPGPNLNLTLQDLMLVGLANIYCLNCSRPKLYSPRSRRCSLSYVVSDLLSKSIHACASTVHNCGFSIDEGLVEVLTLALAVTCSRLVQEIWGHNPERMSQGHMVDGLVTN